MTKELELLQRRHSARSYTAKPLSTEVIAKLRAAITSVNTHEAGMHFQLVTNDAEPFRGFSRSYGMFSGVRNYIAAVVDTSYANYAERAGYFGMELVMKAVELGLGTCFVSGTYSAGHVSARVRVGEQLLYLITLGYEEAKPQRAIARLLTGFIHRKKADAPHFLVSDNSLEMLTTSIPRLPEALEAMACAPSAMNKRPARLVIADIDANSTTGYADGLEVQATVAEDTQAALIDLGIAMRSVSYILPGEWTWGNPATLQP